MFNALRPDELLVGIGRVLRAIADVRGELADFERTQLLSAHSVARLLAAEQRAEPELVDWLRGALEGALDEQDDPATSQARRCIEAARDGVAVGEALGELLVALPDEAPARLAVRRVLAEMTDREVAALAEASR